MDAMETLKQDVQEGRISSERLVDLIVALQKKFKVQIRDDERVRKIRTLEDIYQYILLLKSEGYGSGA